MYQLILTIHVFVAIALIALVLIQHGKGAEIGATFGSGASSTVFGSHGTGSFLFKLTCSLVLAFFITSLSLAYMVSMQHKQNIVFNAIDLPVNNTKEPLLPGE